jgi:hypothetical protein
MFSKDAGWYLHNLDQITAFERWIEVVRSAIPNQILGFVRQAAREALSTLEDDAGGYTRIMSWKSPDGYELYWSLLGAWNEEEGVGAIVSVWVPKTADWLATEADAPPMLGLYYNGRNRAKTREIGEQIYEKLAQFPPKIGDKMSKIEDGSFVCARRLLQFELGANALQDPAAAKISLQKVLAEFTSAARPALEAAKVGAAAVAINP